MQLMKSSLTSKCVQPIRQVKRISVRPNAIQLDATNIIVGVVALTVIVDVGKTFYAQYQRNQKKEEESDDL